MVKRYAFLAIIGLAAFGAAHADTDIASVSYVDSKVETRLDTSVNAEQQMAGKYVVTGTLEVPDAPLPTAN